MASITENEVLEAIRSAVAGIPTDEGALTSEEIGGALGVTAKIAVSRMKPLIRAGKIQVVRTPRPNIAGVVGPVIAYRLAA